MSKSKQTTPSFFEDFRPGDRFTGGPRHITTADLEHMMAASGDRHRLHTDAAYAQQAGFAAPLLHGPFGIAAFLGWFHDSGIGSDTVISMLDSNWRYLGPVVVGDTLSFEMTITRCRRSGKGDRGIVGRHVRIRNGAGVLVQEGRTAMLVRARGTEPDPARELFTPAWAHAIAVRLAQDGAFRAATATWDGAFALACETDETQFRIYKGDVLEAGSRVPNGPAFTLGADALVWTELFTAGSDEFMRRAMQGEFNVRGSAYEYLRLMKAVHLLVAAARELFRDGVAA